jgi:hypothetical protein
LLGRSLQPGLPYTLPTSVSSLFRKPVASEPESVPERAFLESEVVKRATKLIHRYVEREEAALLVQATWAFYLLRTEVPRTPCHLCPRPAPPLTPQPK